MKLKKRCDSASVYKDCFFWVLKLGCIGPQFLINCTVLGLLLLGAQVGLDLTLIFNRLHGLRTVFFWVCCRNHCQVRHTLYQSMRIIAWIKAGSEEIFATLIKSSSS
ncbi:uncharacterized protein LOC143847140 isoform X3 [Tasmannia lanceolata]|uniref:uncharacterized protein LOC143847140 isoform X3 n=1 Tax=Tasmannia lanceolata TaxID=3420 RepID=UPI0040641719